MAQITWPKTADEPYDVTVETDSQDTVKTVDVTTVEVETGEFERFEEVAGQLVAAPKTDLDEKRTLKD